MKPLSRRMIYLGLIFGIAALAAFPIFYQNRMIFFPYRYDPELMPERANPPFIPYRAADGRRQWGCLIEPDPATLRALQSSGGAPQPRSYLVFSGNASTALGMADYYKRIADSTGCRFYLVDYRGYGFNDGAPSEQGLVADALGAYDTMAENGFFDGGVGVIGQSLGGGVAFAIAMQRPVDRLIAISTFTSIDDMALHTPYALYRRFLRTHFPNEQRLRELCLRPPDQRPKEVVVIHSRKDNVIPFAMGERLAACGFPGLKFLTHDSAHHNNTLELMAGELATLFRSGFPESPISGFRFGR